MGYNSTHRFQPTLSAQVTVLITYRPTIAQRIWSDPTCMLLIFAGASAEFAVNPYVDWLFYTGKLPSDPIGRFLSTIDYLRKMLVASPQQREGLAVSLRGVHTDVEQSRGWQIPDEGYRDVLCMDIFYSIEAVPFAFGRPLTTAERDEVVAELAMFGTQMGIPKLPHDYAQLVQRRAGRLPAYACTELTYKLLRSYRGALGRVGYYSLLSLYPLLLEPELLSKMPIAAQPMAPLLRHGLYPLCRSNLIHYVYRFGLPKRLQTVVKSWASDCSSD